MPKVKFLKDLCSGTAGTICDLQDYEANVLIQLGAIELFDENEAAKAAREAAEMAYEHIPPNILLNLNGRPVVSDFGDMVEQPKQQSTVEEPKKKGSKASK